MHWKMHIFMHAYSHIYALIFATELSHWRTEGVGEIPMLTLVTQKALYGRGTSTFQFCQNFELFGTSPLPYWLWFWLGRPRCPQPSASELIGGRVAPSSCPVSCQCPAIVVEVLLKENDHKLHIRESLLASQCLRIGREVYSNIGYFSV